MSLFRRKEEEPPRHEEIMEDLYPRSERTVEIIPKDESYSSVTVDYLARIAIGKSSSTDNEASDFLECPEADNSSPEELYAVEIINGIMTIRAEESKFGDLKDTRLRINKQHISDARIRARAIYYAEKAFSSDGSRAYTRFGTEFDEIIVEWKH